MNIWFTSDHHFGHENIIKYSNRPFANSKEMDEALIEIWNDCIKPEDVVYYVGDFTLRDLDAAKAYLSVLSGKIFIIDGSHDRWIHQRKGFSIYASTYTVQFLHPLESVYTGHTDLQREKGELPVVLCHYAMRSWDRSHYGSWHLFGHHHGSLGSYGLSFDIGVDSHNFRPWHLDEVAEKMKTLAPIVDYSKKH